VLAVAVGCRPDGPAVRRGTTQALLSDLAPSGTPHPSALVRPDLVGVTFREGQAYLPGYQPHQGHLFAIRQVPFAGGERYLAYGKYLAFCGGRPADQSYSAFRAAEGPPVIDAA
jgi:hypothetical protein